MGMLDMFLWVVYPFTVAAIVAMGLVWQYDASRTERTVTASARLLAGLVKVLMVFSTATGVAIVFSNSNAGEPILLLRWLLSLAQLQPDMDLILNISTLSKVHFFITFLFLLSLAFTKEIVYLLRPHLYLKKIYLKLHFEKRG